MLLRHYFLILIITFLFGSAYPVQKVIFNENVPPLLMGSLRMLVVFICLLPFWRFRIPEKKYWLPLLFFSIAMGFLANVFMTLSLNEANIVSPIIIGSQLAVPFAILLSSFFLKEKVSIKKWVLIFISFFGIILLGFDPLIRNEINAVMGLVGFMLLIISSSIFEGQTINEIKTISFQSWLLIFHSGIFVSIAAHMSMFYLYRMYPVNRVFPFYALFPVFGVLLTFIIFYEIPTLITFIGGIIVIVATYFINKEN